LDFSYAYPDLFLAVVALFVTGALLPLLLNTRRGAIAAFVPAAIASALTAALSTLILFSGSTIRLAPPLTASIPSIGIALYIDGVSAFFMLIIGLVATAVSIYSLGYSGGSEEKRGVRSVGFLVVVLLEALAQILGHRRTGGVEPPGSASQSMTSRVLSE